MMPERWFRERTLEQLREIAVEEYEDWGDSSHNQQCELVIKVLVEA